ncbi:MAG: hypothetical protein H0U23_00565 [Blastocatellia bacterium]|nr:hypothetical protein [Blastocatellia bacterium]
MPSYVSIIFILTTLVTVGIFLYVIVKAGTDSLQGKLLFGFVLIWMVIQVVLANTGFFQDFDHLPPRTFAFGPLPFFVLILTYLVFARRFLESMPLAALTLIHTIRIPVEFVLLWLYQAGQVPVEMTFEGSNFDILSGVTAPFVYFLAFRKGTVNRSLLIGWNIAALALLANIVTIAILAFPSPFQTIGLDQPNIGVTYFPFVWLPSIIVPIVLFCHIASIWKLVGQRQP